MDEVVTSNQLTGIYGQEPAKKRPAVDLTRGYIVYIEMFGPSGKGGFYVRTFFVDFSEGGINDQLVFEKAVIAKGNANLFKGKVATQKLPWDEVFDNQIETIHFGWKPCHVSYIFNSPFGSFVGVDSSQELIQPVVFRRDKVVIGKDGKAQIQRYKPNHTFFNLDTDMVDGASVLRFDNLMFVNAAGDRLGDAPSDAAQKEAKRLDYCMDIHIRIDQARLMGLLSETDERLIDPGSLAKSITIVFDPPQTNGGGSGPP